MGIYMRNKRFFRWGFVCLALLAIHFQSDAQTQHASDSSAIRFFSKTPIENIEAVNHKATSTISPAEYSIQFQVPMSGFQFENGLMQKHFNSMYLETDKFPFASFRGRLSDSLDLSKDTVYITKATGILKLHGVDHADVYSGKVETKKGRTTLSCSFKVKLEDHNIKIPGATFLNIAQEIEVKVYFEYKAKPDKPVQH